MKDEHLQLLLGAAFLLSILGIIVLSILKLPAPESLVTVVASTGGALAMAYRGKGNGGDGNGTDSSPATPA